MPLGARYNEYVHLSPTLLVVRDPRDNINPVYIFSQESALPSLVFSFFLELHTLQHTPAVVFILNHPFMHCTAST
jgi:hypothetical protein